MGVDTEAQNHLGGARSMTGSTRCALCHQPLPTAGPVAMVERQRLVHLVCYRPPAPLVHLGGRLDRARRRARSTSTDVSTAPEAT